VAEDVNDDVGKVHEDPLRERQSLDVEGVNSRGGQHVLYVVGNSPNLTIGVP
jgi:hypothetical protein